MCTEQSLLGLGQQVEQDNPEGPGVSKENELVAQGELLEGLFGDWDEMGSDPCTIFSS